MKSIKTTLALFLALTMLLLCGCSMLQKDTSRIVVASVEDYEIKYDEYQAMLEQTYDDNEVDPETDSADTVKMVKDVVIQSLIEKYVRILTIKQLGLDLPTDEDDANEQVQSWKDSIVEQYISHYEAMDDDDALYYATQDMESYRESYGLTDQYLYDYFLDDIYYQRLFEYATKDVSPTEEDITEQYNELVADDTSMYAENLPSFAASYEAGTTLYYIPDGMFFFKRILIPIGSEAAENYKTASDAGDTTGAETAIDEGLSKIQEEAQGVLDKLQKGSDFDALLADYLETDSIMSIGDASTKGLLIYPGCETYNSALTEGVLEQLKMDGDLSGLIATSDGYCICKRVSSLTGGAVPLEDVREYVEQKTLSTMQEEVFDAAMENWQSQYAVVINEDKL